MPILNYIYRKILCNELSHEKKMKLAGFLYNLPIFHQVLESQYDFHPNEKENELSISEQKKIYERYLCKNQWEKNDLEKIFLDAPHRLICKHLRYLRVYEHFFARFREKENLTIVEVGVFGGVFTTLEKILWQECSSYRHRY